MAIHRPTPSPQRAAGRRVNGTTLPGTGAAPQAVRQQQVLVALRQKLSQLSIGDINNIAGAVNGQVLTDVPLTQFPTLLGLAKDIDSGSVQHVFLTPNVDFLYTTVNGGEGQPEDVEEPYMGAILSLVHQYFPAG